MPPKKIESNSCGYVCSVSVAIGDGIVSVGADIAYGIERSFEGLGGKGQRRVLQIGFENEFLVKHLQQLFKIGYQSYKNPLTKLISSILVKYYSHLPDDVLAGLAKKAGVILTNTAAKQVGKKIGKKIAEKVAVKIAQRIAATAAMKTLGKRVGISASVSATGVGIPISMVMLQGLAQKSSKASQRLRGMLPDLWLSLRGEEGLDMLYFLIEEPFKDHVNFIRDAKKSTDKYQIYVERLRHRLKKNESQSN